MNKLMKKMTILTTVAIMALSATPTSAYYEVSGNKIDQYEVKDHQQYVLDDGRNVFVTEVYEKPGIIFGTNRTIKWIDTDTGENGESTLGSWGDTRVYDADATVTWVDDDYDYAPGWD